MRDFLPDRIRLVKELMISGPEVAYADLVLILTAVLSGCAALRWPGRGIDKNRFIELLITQSLPDARCNYVCRARLLGAGSITERNAPWGPPGASTRILRDDEIDLPFSAACTRLPQIPPLDL